MEPVVIITGSSGLIGSALVAQLRDDYSLLALDCVEPKEKYTGVNYQRLDLGNCAAISSFFADYTAPVHAVINLAGYYNFNNTHCLHYDRLLDGLRPLVQAYLTKRTPDSCFIQAGSMAALEPCQPGQKILPSQPNSPRWKYPEFKTKAADYLNLALTGKSFVEFVLAAVYTDQCELVPLYHFLENHRGLGAKRWVFPVTLDRGLTYIHIDDVTSAIAQQLKRPVLSSRLLIGEAEATTYRAIAKKADQAFYGRTLPKICVPKWTAKMGAKVLGGVMQEQFYQPWMMDFSDEHYEFDMSLTEKTLNWTTTHFLKDHLPAMLSGAIGDPKSWQTVNKARPWHANHWTWLPEKDRKMHSD